MTDCVVSAVLALVLCPLTLSGQFALKDITAKDPVVRQAALRRLAALPLSEKERYIPDLARLLRASDEYIPIVLAFAKIGPPAVPTLRDLLTDPTHVVRGCAAEALAMIRPVARKDIASLHSMLKDNDKWVRQRVAESLLSAGAKDPEAELVSRDEWHYLQFRGAQPSGGIGDWIGSLALSDPRTTYNDISSLISVGDPAVPSLIQALKNQDSNIRAGAAEALQDMHVYRPDIEAAFIQAINDPSQRVRDAARFSLLFTISEAASDALLRDEIAEIERKKTAEQRARANRTLPHSLTEILASIPPDPDNTYALDVANQFETKAPDGTVVLTVLHSGEQRTDLLRFWARRNGSYFLVGEDTADNPDGGTPHLSADAFHYHGKAYIHAQRLWEGTGSQHEDKYFRVENGGLVQLKTPEGFPIQLAPKEGVWKGFALDLKDDHLGFEFWIWKEGDSNCCPTAGQVTGTYTIVGDDLRYATWKRSAVNPQ